MDTTTILLEVGLAILLIVVSMLLKRSISIKKMKQAWWDATLFDRNSITCGNFGLNIESIKKEMKKNG